MKVLTLVFLIVFISLIFYVGGAVCSGSFYIPAWNEVTRGMIAFFWVAACAGVTVAWFGDAIKFPTNDR